MARYLGLTLVLIAGFTADARLRAQTPAGAPVETEIATAPVEFDGAVLFRVRGVSSLPAEMRAGLIRDRLTAIAADTTIAIDSLRAVEGDGVTRIVAGATTLMGIVDADASVEQVQRAELAAVHLARLRQAIADYRGARSTGALQRGAVNALLATLALALGIVLVRWIGRWTDRFLTHRLQARIHTVGIQSFELMRAERIWGALRSGLLALQTMAFMAMALVYLGFVLAQFPWTRGVSRDMVTFALAPLQVIGAGIVENIPSLVFLTVLFFVVRLALRVIRLFFDAVETGRVALASFDAEWAQPTYKIVRIAVIAFGLVVAYPYIPGSGSAAFQGISLFLGIVFSLGSSSAIANVIAGYMMTYRRAFKVGDRIKVGNATGDVIETRLQVTHLRSVKNEEIIIPNSQILAGEVLNYSSLARAHGLILHTEVGIGYETPWRQVEAMLHLAAGRTPGLLSEPRPFVLEKALGDFAVTYELNVYCSNVQAMNRLYAELHRHILDVFNEYGIQIMTPAYEGDPDEPKVVPRKDWYAAPAASPPVTQEEPGRPVAT
ncbi:MAG TPA: mechanosensitive ion channel domain-containing protein [Vicinamibacterales bacterium]